MFVYKRAYPVQFVLRKTVVACQGDRIEPELAFHSFALNVNMLRFVAIETEEKDPIRSTNALYRRHIAPARTTSVPLTKLYAR